MQPEHALTRVTSLDDLRDRDGRFLAGTVNVTGYVSLTGLGLEQLPVKFGAVGRDFYCYNNLLTSLEGAPGSVGRDFYCNGNRLTTLVGAHKILKRIGDELFLAGNEIVSGGIGLILVEGLTKIDADQPAFKIINKYLGQGMKGVLRCQEALHDAGYGEHARL